MTTIVSKSRSRCWKLWSIWVNPINQTYVDSTSIKTEQDVANKLMHQVQHQLLIFHNFSTSKNLIAINPTCPYYSLPFIGPHEVHAWVSSSSLVNNSLKCLSLLVKISYCQLFQPIDSLLPWQNAIILVEILGVCSCILLCYLWTFHIGMFCLHPIHW